MGINDKTDVEKFLDAVARLKASGTIESAESIDPDQVSRTHRGYGGDKETPGDARGNDSQRPQCGHWEMESRGGPLNLFAC